MGMDDPRLAAALLTSSPDALAGLFDAYGDRLFRYCWGRLRSRSRAQVRPRQVPSASATPDPDTLPVLGPCGPKLRW